VVVGVVAPVVVPVEGGRIGTGVGHVALASITEPSGHVWQSGCLRRGLQVTPDGVGVGVGVGVGDCCVDGVSLTQEGLSGLLLSI
jgi:hypothetical protein